VFKNFLKKDKLCLLGGEPIIKKPLKPYKTIGYRETKSVLEVMSSGNLSGFVGAWCNQYDGGPFIRKLEEQWCQVFKSRYSISMNSNTSGLIAALGAIGLSPGDEVIVPPMTMSATVMAPLFYGGIPVFVDIEDKFFCLDYEKVVSAITEKTKAIMVVNLFGHPAEIIKLRKLADKKGIYLIEDAAQCPLATENDKFAGTIGHIGVFSLNYHKHIHSGEGGICCTNDYNLALRLKAIRNHGENVLEPLKIDDITNLVGFNFRMTELSAAVGFEQLKKIDKFVSNRETIAKKLSSELSSYDCLQVPLVRESCRHVYYVWAAKIDRNKLEIPRSIIAKALRAEGIPVEEGYTKPLYFLPTFLQRKAIGKNGWPFNLSEKKYNKGICPVAENLYEESLLEFCVCSYQLNKKELKAVIEGFKKVFENLNSLKEYK
tara:strand:+ start:2642 stop:3934 length:1293 start_codon:yes stop_codon:yes gene_type:complete